MLTRARLAKAVFGLGAAISVTWAFVNVRALVEMYEAGAGGAFVTSGAIDVLEYVVPAAIAFWLATRLRERTGRARPLPAPSAPGRVTHDGGASRIARNRHYRRSVQQGDRWRLVRWGVHRRRILAAGASVLLGCVRRVAHQPGRTRATVRCGSC